MERLYIITGANGHLGRNIAKQLLDAGQQVRGLLLPGEQPPEFLRPMELVYGDVRDQQSLRPLFEGAAQKQLVVIHTAAVIDIATQVSQVTQQVNVQGTRNLVELCLEYGIFRLIYVSSVHAIPEGEPGSLIVETSEFSPEWVNGSYAKTKAEATQQVRQSFLDQRLPVVILHPSGMIGPLDPGSNHLNAMLKSYLTHKIVVCVKGGYDIVDVRDVASACIAAVDQGELGETYILSGKHYELRELFHMMKQGTGLRRWVVMLPMWFARLVAPLFEKWALRRHSKPLVTEYSLHAVQSNDNFSHEKATQKLGFETRSIQNTLRDTITWLRRE